MGYYPHYLGNLEKEKDMKTKVRITYDSFHGDYHKGDVGYVDGYCGCGDYTPCAVVVIEKRFTLVPLCAIELYEDENN